MKVAYQKLDLGNHQVRARLFDDLIQAVEHDEVARQYLEDLQEYTEGMEEQLAWQS